jgi:hypothetical protein
LDDWLLFGLIGLLWIALLLNLLLQRVQLFGQTLDLGEALFIERLELLLKLVLLRFLLFSHRLLL